MLITHSSSLCLSNMYEFNFYGKLYFVCFPCFATFAFMLITRSLFLYLSNMYEFNFYLLHGYNGKLYWWQYLNGQHDTVHNNLIQENGFPKTDHG